MVPPQPGGEARVVQHAAHAARDSRAPLLCRFHPYRAPIGIITTALYIPLRQQALDHGGHSGWSYGQVLGKFLHHAALMLDEHSQERDLSWRGPQFRYILPTRPGARRVGIQWQVCMYTPQHLRNDLEQGHRYVCIVLYRFSDHLE